MAEVRSRLAADGGTKAAEDSAKLLDSAEKDVQQGRDLAERCSRREAEVAVHYKLR